MKGWKLTDLNQAFFEMDVHGFTLLEDVLTDDQVTKMREVLMDLDAKIGEEQRFLGSAGHVSNLPALDRIQFIEDGGQTKSSQIYFPPDC